VELWGCRGGDCHSCTHSYAKRQTKVDPDNESGSRAAYFREYNRDHRAERTAAQQRWRDKKRREGRVDSESTDTA